MERMTLEEAHTAGEEKIQIGHLLWKKDCSCQHCSGLQNNSTGYHNGSLGILTIAESHIPFHSRNYLLFISLSGKFHELAADIPHGE